MRFVFLFLCLCSALTEDEQEKIHILQKWIKQMQEDMIQNRELCAQQFNTIQKELNVMEYNYQRYLKDKELWQTQYRVYQEHRNELQNCQDTISKTKDQINELKQKISYDLEKWIKHHNQ